MGCAPLFGIGRNERSLGEAAGGAKNGAYLRGLWKEVYGRQPIRLKQAGGRWTNEYGQPCRAAFPAALCKEAHLEAGVLEAGRGRRR